MVVSGAIGGALVAVVLANTRKPVTPAPPGLTAVPQHARESFAPTVERGARYRFPAPAQSTSAEAPDAGSARAERTDDTPPDPVAERVAKEKEYADDLSNHEKDGRDPAWAPRAESTLARSIQDTLGDERIVRVDCKTTSCVAHIQWPTREAAAKEYQKLLITSFEPNCAVKILLHEQEPGGPYRERMILDCTDSRAEQ